MATLEDLQIPLGEPLDYDVPAPPVGENWALWGGTWPPGITADYYVSALQGTPTEVGVWTVSMQPVGGYGDPVGEPVDWTITVVGPAQVIEPPAPVITDTGYTLPEVEGVEWSVNGQPAEPGTYEPDTSAGPVTVAIVAEPAEGYEFDPPAEVVTATFEPAPGPDPDPDPDPDPSWPDPEPAPEAVIVAGGDRLAASLRWTSEADRAAARDAYETVLLVAWGYTRGRGFTEALEPTYPIGRVVAMAAARLAVNPEQLDRWQVSGDSETLNAFQGFTLAERHVLDRYRRRFA